jgi:phage terminase small subunit
MSGKKPGRPTGSADLLRLLPDGQVPERDVKIIENRYVKGLTLADSALEAGYLAETRAAAASYANGVIRRYRDSNPEFLRELGACGVSIHSVAQQIAEGLESTIFVKVRNGDGGEDLREVPDWAARHRFVETCLDIFGGRAPKRLEVAAEVTFEERLAALTADEDEAG